MRRSLDVQLNRKVSIPTLQAIALQLKDEAPSTYERTSISYYLPDMTVGAGAWAVTNFTPELEVRILGLSAEDEAKLLAQSEEERGEIIGRWVDDRPMVGSLITIFREDGKLFIKELFADGSSFSRHVTETQTPLGPRFDQVENFGTGDHWILRPDGSLEIRDEEGLIGIARDAGN